MGLIYDSLGFISWCLDQDWDTLSARAPLVTALVALCALITAIVSIVVQANIARRRAAVDLFVKAEMDDKMVTYYHECVRDLENVATASADQISSFGQ